MVGMGDMVYTAGDHMDAWEVVLSEHSVTTVCADVKEGMKQDMDHALMMLAPLTKEIGIVGKHKTTIPMLHVMATIRYVLTLI